MKYRFAKSTKVSVNNVKANVTIGGKTEADLKTEILPVTLAADFDADSNVTLYLKDYTVGTVVLVSDMPEKIGQTETAFILPEAEANTVELKKGTLV